MKVRCKDGGWTGISSKFNVYGIGEIVVNFVSEEEEPLGADSVYIHDCDVYLEQLRNWKDMAQAFRDNELITDNHNTHFFEPRTPEDRERGFTLT